MKTVKFVTKHFGENSTTSHSLYAVYDPLNPPDLTVTAWRCIMSDDDRLVEINLYGLADREIPEWMSPEEYLSNEINLKYLWGRGAEKDWDETTTRGLLCLNGIHQFLAIKLLKTKNFRSEFRKSVCDKVIEWLKTPSEERKYPSPFSTRMIEALTSVHDYVALKRIDNNIYWDR